jgi:hypothetical protein
MSLKRCIALLFTVISATYAQQSPYFPRNGANAAAQALREIKNPSVYLVVALAPGLEDRASIANFRIGTGANVAVAFVTNGEDIPSDLNGEMFYELASRRKEEAYQTLSYLGAQSYFLNVPVSQFSNGNSCFSPTPAIAKMLIDRLDSVVTQIKPDVLVLDRDPLSVAKESARSAYLRQLIVNTLHDKKRMSRWRIKRFFVETFESQDAVVVPVEQRDSVWSESYAHMAQRAEEHYASLKYQLPLWKEGAAHRYIQVFPEKAKSPLPLNKGLPHIGIPLQGVSAAIHSLASINKLSNREKRLEALHPAIAQIDALIQSRAQSMDPIDLRVLATWKLKLENLRCQILDVRIPYSVSDTIVTPIQVFFLKFGKFAAAFSNGKTQILFPGVVQKQWIVNEAQSTFYPLKDSSQFRVLSPRSLSLNSTETPQGFGAMQLRTPLIFIVSHQDPDPSRNFMYREEVPLIIAPYRSAEILSPRVIMHRDTIICVRFRSNVRDETKGAVYVNDPVVSSPQRKIVFPGKNFVETDSLPLFWKDTVLTAPHEATIWAGAGNPVGSFAVQPLNVKVSARARVALCTAMENSPVQIALRRLGVATILLDSTNFSSQGLFHNSAIIVDQFSFNKFLGLSNQLDSMEQWIQRGGRLIILPQYGAERKNPFLGNDITFADLSAGDCKEKLFVDTTDGIFHFPNTIEKSGFPEELFALSYSELTERKSGDSKILMRAGNRVLILEKRLEAGRIFYCAMNLYPRLLDLHTPSYELLANLISAGLEQ